MNYVQGILGLVKIGISKTTPNFLFQKFKESSQVKVQTGKGFKLTQTTRITIAQIMT